ncbi:MAG: hypothetical protein AAB899_02545 [Patescibacteria group bacterium]
MPRIPIPNEVKVKVGIEQGCVYNFSPDIAIPNHYFIVLNKAPKDDNEIYLASFTSNKEGVKRFIQHHKLDEKTYIEIKKGDCSFLATSKESCINCNQFRRYDVQKLIERIDASDGSCNYPKIPETLLKKILIGIGASKMIAKDVKISCGA